MEGFLGQVKLFPYDFSPSGWTACEGQLLKIRENDALFSLLGTRFGGDGKTTFGLPNLKDAAPDHVGYFINVRGIMPSRH